MRSLLWRHWRRLPTNKVKWQSKITGISGTELRQVSQLKTSGFIIITLFIVKPLYLSYLSLLAKSYYSSRVFSPEFQTHIFKYSFSSLIQIYHRDLKYTLFKKELILFHKLNLIFCLGLVSVFVLKLQSIMSPNPGQELGIISTYLPYLALPKCPLSPDDSTCKTFLKYTLLSVVSLPGIFVLPCHPVVAYLINSTRCFHSYAPKTSAVFKKYL